MTDRFANMPTLLPASLHDAASLRASVTFPVVVALFVSVMAGCDSPRGAPGSAGPAPAASSLPRKVDIVVVDGVVRDVREVIRVERERAEREGRALVVYVGAPWCEPCQRFHAAAAAGELDGKFPTLRLLEFDRDRHEAGLGEAGCLSQMIPLFAMPTGDGRCSEKRVEGAIKGEGAVGFIVPRLERILRD